MKKKKSASQLSLLLAAFGSLFLFAGAGVVLAGY